ILHSCTVRTLDEHHTVAEAVAVGGGRVLAVGPSTDLLGRYPGAERRDLHGATVLPGLIDSHLHLLQLGLNSFAVDLSGARSVADVLDALRAQAAETGRGDWVVCSSRWHESQLAEGRFPTRGELDAAVPWNPVLLRRGGHNVAANSAALTAAGITRDTPDPPGGTYVRDGAGELTGHIIGAPAFGRVVALVPRPDEARLVEAIRVASRQVAAAGITGVIEPGLGSGEIAAYRRARTEGALGVRVVLMPRLEPGVTPEDGARAVAAFERLEPAGGDAFLKVGGIKLVADGGVETNYLREPYAHADDPAAPLGKPRVSKENLIAVCRPAARAGRQVGVHCVGDAAIDLVLDAFAAVNEEESIAGLRWTLIHMTLARPEHVARAEALGLVLAVQQPLIDALGAGWVKYWGRERAAQASPLRAYAASRLLVGTGSDAPVTDFSPWRAFWSAATRETAHAGVLGPEQAVDAATMLRWYTAGSAALSFDDKERGEIRPGMLADLIAVEPDPLRLPAEELKDVQVRLTVVDGRVVYERERGSASGG
ncbi:MAG: amidohydrolase, partial [Dehalococcoidia bacterium]